MTGDTVFYKQGKAELQQLYGIFGDPEAQATERGRSAAAFNPATGSLRPRAGHRRPAAHKDGHRTTPGKNYRAAIRN